MDGKQMTPGGFHFLEYRWALKDAFDFISSIGKVNIFHQVHALNRQCKEGLEKMAHVKLHTPMSDGFSSGIICFEVPGMTAKEVVSRLKERRVIATASPYKISFPRFTPGIINMPSDVDKALEAVFDLRNQ
jgi:isopenicillin-N epimerase